MALRRSSGRNGRVGCGKLACVLAASLAVGAPLSHGDEPLDYLQQRPPAKPEPQREYSEEEIAEIVPEWPNPYLSFLPAEANPDYAYWRARARVEARARQDRLVSAASLAAVTALVVGSDDEPNDTRETASSVPGFGSHEDEDREARIDGTFTPPPETAIGPFAEDDGSIPLASETGLVGRGMVRASGEIGDGPFGSAGAGTGDFDFFRIGGVAAGQTILIDVDTPVGPLDSFVALYDATGALLAVNDDSPGSADSLLQLVAPAAGDYYVSIGGYPASILADPFDSASGPGSTSEGPYELRIGVDPNDVDHFGFELEAGDILGAAISGAGTRLELYAPDGELRVGSSQDVTFIHPPTSPLPGGGNAALSYVIETAGTWTIRAAGAAGAYRLDLRVETNPLLGGEEGDVQILFVDFDGAMVDSSIFGGAGSRTLSPLAAFLPRWGLSAGDQDAVIDAILAAVEESLSVDMRERGSNGDFDASGRPGEFDIEIQNSRDHPDPGADPNATRIVIGGTIPELGISTIGIAQSIDVGNFETQEAAVVLLDLLSAPASNPNSLNRFPLAPGTVRLDIVGVGVGNVAAHEAGHVFGNFHTEQFVTPPNVMDQGGNLAGTIGVGPDGIFGSADDVDVDFGRDRYVPNEGFAGVEDTLNAVAFGLPTPVVAIPVGVDVRPGNDENQVNLESAGLIPIALLGSASFDVTQIDVATLAIGAAGSPPDGKLQTRDASQDGFADLVFHVRTPATALAPGDAELCVAGQLLDGRPIAGCDAVRIVPELCAFGPGAGGGLLHPEGPENGDFELGDFTGWQQINTGFGGIFIDDGSRLPPGGGGRVLPFEGRFAALTEQLGPGQHTLFVDVTLDADLAEARLAWADHLRNLAGTFVDPVQEWRVEVWDPASNAVLAQLFSTQPGDPAIQDWTERDADLSPWIGQTIRIAFTEQDSLFYFNARLDRVQVLVRRYVEAGIDIKPGEAGNQINPMSQGVVPVALLGSDGFDVRRIDVLTLSFGPGGARPAHQICREEVFEGHIADVDLDGDEDLLVHFETPGSGIAVGDDQACVSGETLDGEGFFACDAVATVPPACGLGFELVLLAPLLRRLRGRRTVSR